MITSSKKNINPGDLCLYGSSIPVLVLERYYRSSSGLNNHKGEYACLCLVYSKVYCLLASELRKI